jgi:NAD(P)-dependent dehydrogenase (short-subunit alcohol dehydrogenase family)
MSQETKAFALVTGASSGIGAVYADRLAKRGALVAQTLRSVMPHHQTGGVPMAEIRIDTLERLGAGLRVASCPRPPASSL